MTLPSTTNMDYSAFKDGKLPPLEPMLQDPGYLRVAGDWWYDDPVLGRQHVLQDTRTDLGSTPQILRALPQFDPLKHCIAAALDHDNGFMYGFHTLHQTNDKFLRCAYLTEPGKTIPRLWYAGLRIGSWMPWRDYRKRGDGPQREDFYTFEAYMRGRGYYAAVKAGRVWTP